MALFISKAAFWVIHAPAHVVNIYIPNLIRKLLTLIGIKTFHNESKKITVISEGAITQQIFSLDTIAKRCYNAPAYSGHLGTVFCALRPSRPIAYNRQIVDGADGNPICLDWFLANTENNNIGNGIMIIFPGLASWSQTNYVQHYLWHAHDKGLHCCVFNARGMGDTPLTQPRLMSASWTSDIRWVTHTSLSKETLSLRFGAAADNIWAVGFSLGGVILAKFLSEEGESDVQKHPFNAAIIINSPLDTLASNANMKRLKNFLYLKNMTTGLIHYAFRHKDILPYLPGLQEEAIRKDPVGFLKKIKSIYDFDKYINAPHNGFMSPEEYYSAVNTITSLRHSKIPTLCVIARDDPVVGDPPEKELKELVNINNLIAFIELPHGGHIGYIGSPMDEWKERPSVMEILTTDICIASQNNNK